ncbi:MAG TPA: tRNA dihydrouridine synthase DusB [Thermoanaerobacterales bacterium]|nr:tRNA dihydrouridine synthase DusB [Thermoanaerobacterales bacterium]
MAGITDRPFRMICKEMGADVLITEMVSTRGLFYDDQKTRKLLEIGDEEHPIGVQLFGNDPEFFSHAAKKIRDFNFDFININMGCPTPKIVKNGDGCALMKVPDLAARIIEYTVRASENPVSIKIRKGWDESSVNAVEFARMAEKSGASQVFVHGRTRESFYSGKADWDIIRRVKEAVGIPVIGNGDVFSPQDAKAMLEKTGCDGVMIGRGALGNPWIFREVKYFLKTGRQLPPPEMEEKLETILLHMDRAIDFYGERLGVLEMRKHIGWYLKGLPNSAAVKRAIQEEKDPRQIKHMLTKFFEVLVNGSK